ncbi:TPA: DsbA family protein [Candidatus Woesearchaeota archaeon]|nr:DsbA family protein [Candidatus Woesearchaeota archaeon]HII69318.1 DsbA family protein [Candidatus Woesearchaeota archaeon]
MDEEKNREDIPKEQEDEHAQDMSKEEPSPAEEKEPAKEAKPGHEHHHKASHKKDAHTWKIATAVLAIVAVVLAVVAFGNGNAAAEGLSADGAGEKAVSYINTNILPPGTEATLKGVEEKNGLYNVMIEIQGRTYEDTYITKDGQMLFPSGFDTTAPPDFGDDPGTQAPAELVEVSEDDDAVKGSADAPVTIIEFSDFECPYCARFFADTLPQIEEQYINTGKVRLIYRDFPLSFHPQAQKAAEASECADDQGKYWEMHDLLFGKGVAGGVTTFKQYAEDLALDTKTFNECLDSGEKAAEISADLADGSAVGVSGTPGFFINGIPVSGAQPFSVFKQVIDEELAKAE